MDNLEYQIRQINKTNKTSIYDSNNEDNNYAIDVAAGSYHTVVLKQDGTVWTVGLNNYGQLGNGTNTSSDEFVKVEGLQEKVIAIAANNLTTYALTENGNVYGWGYNSYGQLGINSTATCYSPVKMQKYLTLYRFLQEKIIL